MAKAAKRKTVKKKKDDLLIEDQVTNAPAAEEEDIPEEWQVDLTEDDLRDDEAYESYHEEEHEEEGQQSDISETVKSVFSSTTVWGILVSLFARIAAYLGYEFGDTDSQTELVNTLAVYVPLLIGFGGDLVAIRGRLKAKKKLVFRKKKRK